VRDATDVAVIETTSLRTTHARAAGVWPAHGNLAPKSAKTLEIVKPATPDAWSGPKRCSGCYRVPVGIVSGYKANETGV